MDTILTLGPWTWLIAGLILLGLELLAPGVFMLWLGLAAIAVGVVTFAVTLSWQAQIVTFVVLAVAAVPLWRKLSRRDVPAPHSEFLNRRAAALVGRTYTLEKPIAGGMGTVRVDDTVWRISGPDCPAGSRVRVVRTDGATLEVEAAA